MVPRGLGAQSASGRGRALTACGDRGPALAANAIGYRDRVPPDLLILNPASAAGATGRRRQQIVRAVERRFGPLVVEETGAPGDATRLARQATLRGVERIFVAGGDGTASEIAGGILDARDAVRVGALPTPRARPLLCLLPLGSGRDLARSLGLPGALDRALDLFAEAGERRIDAGRVEFFDHEGHTRRRYFVNEASAGLSASTVARVGRVAKRVGPRIGFGLGAIAAILSHRPIEAAVEIDGKRVHEGAFSLVVIANGCYFGAGMRVAPRARLDDGRLELILVKGLSVPRLLVNLPRLYLGRHAGHPRVSFHAARTVALLPKETDAPIELDGEAVGRLPLRAEVLPGVLRVCAPTPEHVERPASRPR